MASALGARFDGGSESDARARGGEAHRDEVGVADFLEAGEGDADQIIEARGLKQVSDTGALESMVEAVIADNPDQVAQYLAADEAKQKKLSGFFVGQIMKASKGQANPQMVNELLLKKLNDQS